MDTLSISNILKYYNQGCNYLGSGPRLSWGGTSPKVFLEMATTSDPKNLHDQEKSVTPLSWSFAEMDSFPPIRNKQGGKFSCLGRD